MSTELKSIKKALDEIEYHLDMVREEMAKREMPWRLQIAARLLAGKVVPFGIVDVGAFADEALDAADLLIKAHEESAE